MKKGGRISQALFECMSTEVEVKVRKNQAAILEYWLPQEDTVTVKSAG